MNMLGESKNGKYIFTNEKYINYYDNNLNLISIIDIYIYIVY